MSILFKNSNYHRHPAYGQMLELALCCYVKALELNHSSVYIEWQNVRFLWDDAGRSYGGFKLPSSDSLPFTFVNHGDRVDVDTVIDIGEPNCLYEGCDPIISKSGCRMRPCQEYMRLYFDRHGCIPEINVNSKETERPYILIHYRESQKAKQQYKNIHPNIFMKFIRYIEKNYDVDIYKIGEPSKLDDMCDKTFEYFLDDASEYFELVSGCELYMGPLSGPWIVPVYLKTPLIALAKDQSTCDNEMKGMGSLLRDNQNMILIKKENYEYIKSLLHEQLKDI